MTIFEDAQRLLDKAVERNRKIIAFVMLAYMAAFPFLKSKFTEIYEVICGRDKLILLGSKIEFYGDSLIAILCAWVILALVIAVLRRRPSLEISERGVSIRHLISNRTIAWQNTGEFFFMENSGGLPFVYFLKCRLPGLRTARFGLYPKSLSVMPLFQNPELLVCKLNACRAKALGQMRLQEPHR